MGIISGTQLAKKLREEIKNEASQLREKGITPTLAVVLVGDNKASRSYVNSKHKACLENSINSFNVTKPKEEEIFKSNHFSSIDVMDDSGRNIIQTEMRNKGSNW